MGSKSIKPSEGIDRFSSLPEPLLSCILSLLPTKYAVATSLLSKRWKFLWTSITNLEFDGEDFRRSYPENALDMRRKKFTQFVNRVLLLLNPPCIQNFCLKYEDEFCDPLDIDSWVCAAVRRTVQKLELHLVMTQSMELPLSHFHCKTLAFLKLEGDIHFKIAEAASICFPNLHTLHLSKIEFTFANNCSVSFPSLKDLLLDSVRYTDEESVHKLFASCSALEILIIKRSAEDNAPNLIISIPSLISLAICFWDFHYWPSRLRIDTPALQYLSVEDGSMCCFTSVNLSSLLEATIMLENSGMHPDDLMKSYYTNIFKFVGGLFNAKLLSLEGVGFVRVFSSMSANVAPVFCNLTRLQLTGYCCWSWSFVNNLLECMDNLEHLVLNIEEPFECERDPWWMEPLRVPMCLLHRVATISFSDMICGCSNELEMVRYFLKNAKVLKMLTVVSTAGTDAEKYKLMQNLLLSPRGSQECQVDVDGGRLLGFREGFYNRERFYWSRFFDE